MRAHLAGKSHKCVYQLVSSYSSKRIYLYQVLGRVIFVHNLATALRDHGWTSAVKTTEFADWVTISTEEGNGGNDKAKQRSKRF